MRELAQTSNPLCVVDSLGLQLAKLGQGLCSGTYSFPPAPSNEQEEGHVVPKQPGTRFHKLCPVSVAGLYIHLKPRPFLARLFSNSC